MRVIIEAPDLEGVEVGLREIRQALPFLPLRGGRTIRDARCSTIGNTARVRDVSVYGSPDRPIAKVGAPYPTPAWMLGKTE